MTLRNRGQQLLVEWCRLNGVVRSDGTPDSRELARRYQKTARRLKGVRAPKHPPFAGAGAWLAGLWIPQADSAACIEELTDGWCPTTAWTEEPKP